MFFKQYRIIYKRIGILVFLCVFLCSSVFAQVSTLPSNLIMPTPGTMIGTSAPIEPTLLKGITLNPQDPFLFDFIIAESQHSTSIRFQEESEKLIKYFLAALTTPENDLWVNLSPYENNRMIADKFGQTEMGRDMLAQDYLLKQLTASLLYPEGEVGKKFWKTIYDKAAQELGAINIPSDTFHKIWIVPDKSVVYENGTTGYVVEASLKVMLEEDYLLAQNLTGQEQSADKVHPMHSDLMKDIVIPVIQKEINTGDHFAPLRQIYHSIILAQWLKQRLKNTEHPLQEYAERNKVAGVDHRQEQINQNIYDEYMQALKKGAYNYIKEEMDPVLQEPIPRKYFSGGNQLGHTPQTIDEAQLTSNHLASIDTAALTDTRVRLEPVAQDNASLTEDERLEVNSLLHDLRSGLNYVFVFFQAREMGHFPAGKLFYDAIHEATQELSARIEEVRSTEDSILGHISLASGYGNYFELVRQTAQRLQADYPDDEFLEPLAVFEREANYALEALGQLDTLLTGNGTFSTESFERVNINLLINEVLARFRHRHPDIRVRVSFPKMATFTAANPVNLRRVLINILNNAADHHATNISVRLHLVSNPENFSIIVGDNGDGIAPEVLTSLNSGQRYTSKAVQDRHGFGTLGSRRILEQAEGRLHFDSKGHGQRKGAEVTITLQHINDDLYHPNRQDQWERIAHRAQSFISLFGTVLNTSETYADPVLSHFQTLLTTYQRRFIALRQMYDELVADENVPLRNERFRCLAVHTFQDQVDFINQVSRQLPEVVRQLQPIDAGYADTLRRAGSRYLIPAFIQVTRYMNVHSTSVMDVNALAQHHASFFQLVNTTEEQPIRMFHTPLNYPTVRGNLFALNNTVARTFARVETDIRKRGPFKTLTFHAGLSRFRESVYLSVRNNIANNAISFAGATITSMFPPVQENQQNPKQVEMGLETQLASLRTLLTDAQSALEEFHQQWGGDDLTPVLEELAQALDANTDKLMQGNLHSERLTRSSSYINKILAVMINHHIHLSDRPLQRLLELVRRRSSVFGQSFPVMLAIDNLTRASNFTEDDFLPNEGWVNLHDAVDTAARLVQATTGMNVETHLDPRARFIQGNRAEIIYALFALMQESSRRTWGADNPSLTVVVDLEEIWSEQNQKSTEVTIRLQDNRPNHARFWTDSLLRYLYAPDAPTVVYENVRAAKVLANPKTQNISVSNMTGPLEGTELTVRLPVPDLHPSFHEPGKTQGQWAVGFTDLMANGPDWMEALATSQRIDLQHALIQFFSYNQGLLASEQQVRALNVISPFLAPEYFAGKQLRDVSSRSLISHVANHYLSGVGIAHICQALIEGGFIESEQVERVLDLDTGTWFYAPFLIKSDVFPNLTHAVGVDGDEQAVAEAKKILFGGHPHKLNKDMVLVLHANERAPRFLATHPSLQRHLGKNPKVDLMFLHSPKSYGVHTAPAYRAMLKQALPLLNKEGVVIITMPIAQGRENVEDNLTQFRRNFFKALLGVHYDRLIFDFKNVGLFRSDDFGPMEAIVITRENLKAIKNDNLLSKSYPPRVTSAEVIHHLAQPEVSQLVLRRLDELILLLQQFLDRERKTVQELSAKRKLASAKEEQMDWINQSLEEALGKCFVYLQLISDAKDRLRLFAENKGNPPAGIQYILFDSLNQVSYWTGELLNIIDNHLPEDIRVWAEELIIAIQKHTTPTPTIAQDIAEKIGLASNQEVRFFLNELRMLPTGRAEVLPPDLERRRRSFWPKIDNIIFLDVPRRTWQDPLTIYYRLPLFVAGTNLAQEREKALAVMRKKADEMTFDQRIHELRSDVQGLRSMQERVNQGAIGITPNDEAMQTEGGVDLKDVNVDIQGDSALLTQALSNINQSQINQGHFAGLRPIIIKTTRIANPRLHLAISR